MLTPMRILFAQTNTNPYLNPFPLGAALVAARLRIGDLPAVRADEEDLHRAVLHPGAVE